MNQAELFKAVSESEGLSNVEDWTAALDKHCPGWRGTVIKDERKKDNEAMIICFNDDSGVVVYRGKHFHLSPPMADETFTAIDNLAKKRNAGLAKAFFIYFDRVLED